MNPQLRFLHRKFVCTRYSHNGAIEFATMSSTAPTTRTTKPIKKIKKQMKNYLQIKNFLRKINLKKLTFHVNGK